MDAPARQRTLRATIDWSVRLLSAGQHRAFARLSVFVDGWTLDAAENVTEADLDDLTALVDHSLVRRDGERFRMLETIREAAADELAASDDAERARAAHARFFHRLVTSVVTGSIGGGQDPALLILRDDRANLRAAFTWLLEHGRFEDATDLALAQ